MGLTCTCMYCIWKVTNGKTDVINHRKLSDVMLCDVKMFLQTCGVCFNIWRIHAYPDIFSNTFFYLTTVFFRSP